MLPLDWDEGPFSSGSSEVLDGYGKGERGREKGEGSEEALLEVKREREQTLEKVYNSAQRGRILHVLGGGDTLTPITSLSRQSVTAPRKVLPSEVYLTRPNVAETKGPC